MPGTPIRASVAVAHQHAISFDDQHAWRGLVLQLAGRLLGRLHLLNRTALLAFQFSTHPLSVRAQRFTADLHTGQLIQQPRRFAKGRQRCHARLPARQPAAGALMWCQRQGAIRRTPRLSAPITAVARADEH